MDVAGAGLGLDDGTSAVDRCGDVVAVEVALHGEGLLDVDAAGAGAGVDREGGGLADGEADAAGAGT